jgi:Ca-activated chloride channel family protein
MDFGNLYMSLWGILGYLAWVASFFYLLKRPEIFVPMRYAVSRYPVSRVIVFILGTLGWLAVTISLAEPRKPIGFAKNKIDVNDVFFVVDVSDSMRADDFKPNRLEAAKAKVRDFVNLRPTDRIGIIMFSERIYTLLPLTTDLDLVNQMIDEIKTGDGLGTGTNIGDALGLAVARGAQSLAKSKIIILLTDGVSNVGSMTPLQAAEEAKEQDIKVYTIGIGGSADARIPTRRTAWGSQRYRNIPGGSFDLETLDQIADITGGKSYVAQDVKALKNVLLEIEKLERTEIDTSQRIVYEQMYLKFLLAGAIMLLMTEASRRFAVREGE